MCIGVVTITLAVFLVHAFDLNSVSREISKILTNGNLEEITTHSSGWRKRGVLGKECAKWIVLTTINSPTEQVKYIRDAHPGWCVLVAGDTKTPRDWKYKNVVYLSVEEQDRLAGKFKIISLIPYNSYLRKMVGYLYAMEHGAKFIYETDDDNSPSDGLLGFRYRTFKGLETVPTATTTTTTHTCLSIRTLTSARRACGPAATRSSSSAIACAKHILRCTRTSLARDYKNLFK
jgi:hypothetical protein